MSALDIILLVLLPVQALSFLTFVGANSVTNRRLRRVAEELVMLRVAVRVGSSVESTSGEAGDSK